MPKKVREASLKYCFLLIKCRRMINGMERIKKNDNENRPVIQRTNF
jgi:hypothetical protein